MRGWLALAIGVILYDVLAEESLSAAFERAVRKRGKLVTVAWVVLSLHLFRKLPRKLDPIYLTVGGIRRLVCANPCAYGIE